MSLKPLNSLKYIAHKQLFFTALISTFCMFIMAQKAIAEPNDALPSSTLIYDLSNSMWAPLNNTPKITHAQKGIISSIENLNKKINFGLLAFGHEEKSGCNNVEEITPLTRLNTNKTIANLKPLRPRGNAPIGKALMDAANMSANRATPYTIILLSDGASNCPIDPCKTSKSLKGALKFLTIDVIALGQTNDKSLKTLSCISKNTGGKLTYVASSKAVTQAIQASFKRTSNRLTTHIANLKKAPPAKPPSKEATIAKTTTETPENGWAGATEIIVSPTKKETTGAVLGKNQKNSLNGRFSDPQKQIQKNQGGLALLALLIDKGQPIKSGIVWRIYKEKPEKTSGKHKLISVFKTADPVMSLPQGNYLINAAYGRAFLTRKVKIMAGKNITEQFVLNAGGLRVASVLANGSPVAENTVYFDILSDERDQFGKRLKVLEKVRPGLVVRLNAGIYHIVSTYGDANAQSRSDVSVEAGKLTEASIDHKSAKVTFKLVYQKGGEALADTKWSLLTANGTIIKKSAGALPTHLLAAGDYTILAERGDKQYSQDFSILAGDIRQIEVIIQ